MPLRNQYTYGAAAFFGGTYLGAVLVDFYKFKRNQKRTREAVAAYKARRKQR